jgi:septum formation protein
VAWSRPGRPCRVRVVESRVRFRVLSRADVASYTAAVNPLDKAGAYDIASRGGRVVESFLGSRSNIMGLPVETVARLLARTGPGRGRLAP